MGWRRSNKFYSGCLQKQFGIVLGTRYFRFFFLFFFVLFHLCLFFSIKDLKIKENMHNNGTCHDLISLCIKEIKLIDLIVNSLLTCLVYYDSAGSRQGGRSSSLDPPLL